MLQYLLRPSVEDCLNLWFGKSERTDPEIRNRFGVDVVLASKGHHDHWALDIEHPRRLVALVILLDQFPRNMYRDTARTYANDARCRDRVKRALRAGVSERLRLIERVVQRQLAVIQRFGRFPHRNPVLQRASSAIELAFLGNSAFRFDTWRQRLSAPRSLGVAAEAAQGVDGAGLGGVRLVLGAELLRQRHFGFAPGKHGAMPQCPKIHFGQAQQKCCCEKRPRVGAAFGRTRHYRSGSKPCKTRLAGSRSLTDCFAPGGTCDRPAC